MPDYLFSIDLEDVRDFIPNGDRYKERVPQNVDRYLQWLDKHQFKATFFTVGVVARKYPDIIEKLVDEGHEIACHSDKHIHLTEQNVQSFKEDLEQNLESLYQAGAKQIEGFRAPTFSLVEKSKWAHQVLEELGFTYSSSVLPAKNPLFGWPEFGGEPRKINGLWELPITLGKFAWMTLPLGGGIYFRVLPSFIINNFFSNRKASDATVLGYFHPYDVDTEQERFMHPHLNDSALYNWLMYKGRGQVFGKLDYLIHQGWNVRTYRSVIADWNANK